MTDCTIAEPEVSALLIWKPAIGCIYTYLKVMHKKSYLTVLNC
jgi:hypothetical protein